MLHIFIFGSVMEQVYLQARRALRALRGLVRLKSLVQGKGVRRQATSTLQSMQTLARLQYQIRERRLRLSEDKQACARKLQQKHNKDFAKVKLNPHKDCLILLVSFFFNDCICVFCEIDWRKLG